MNMKIKDNRIMRLIKGQFLNALLPYCLIAFKMPNLQAVERLSRLIALIKKEFLAIFKDPKNRALIIMPPLLQLFIFANCITMEVRNIDVSILDYSNSFQSRELISRFSNSKWFRKVRFRKNPQELKEDINLKNSLIGIVIQNDFERGIKSASGSEILIISDGRQTNSATLASSYASEIINEYSLELAELQGIKTPQINIITRNWYNPNIEYKWFLTVSMIALLALVLSLLLSSLSIARERELGTFEQLIVSPLSNDEILLAKTIAPLVVTIILSLIITFIIAFFFKVPFSGSILMYLFATFISLFSVIGIGLFISSLAYTQQQAILGVFAFQTPAVLLSGFVSPVEDMNAFFRFLSAFNPMRYYMLIVKGIYFKNMDNYVVLLNLIPLVMIAIFVLAIARRTFYKAIGQ